MDGSDAAGRKAGRRAVVGRDAERRREAGRSTLETDMFAAERLLGGSRAERRCRAKGLLQRLMLRIGAQSFPRRVAARSCRSPKLLGARAGSPVAVQHANLNVHSSTHLNITPRCSYWQLNNP